MRNRERCHKKLKNSDSVEGLLYRQDQLFFRINKLFLKLDCLYRLIKAPVTNESSVSSNESKVVYHKFPSTVDSDNHTFESPLYYKIGDRIPVNVFSYRSNSLFNRFSLSSGDKYYSHSTRSEFHRSATTLPNKKFNTIVEQKKILLKKAVSDEGLGRTTNFYASLRMENGSPNLYRANRPLFQLLPLSRTRSVENNGTTLLCCNPGESVSSVYNGVNNELILDAKRSAEKRKQQYIKQIAMKVPLPVVAQWYRYFILNSLPSVSDSSSNNFLRLQQEDKEKSSLHETPNSLDKQNVKGCLYSKDFTKDANSCDSTPQETEYARDRGASITKTLSRDSLQEELKDRLANYLTEMRFSTQDLQLQRREPIKNSVSCHDIYCPESTTLPKLPSELGSLDVSELLLSKFFDVSLQPEMSVGSGGNVLYQSDSLETKDKNDVDFNGNVDRIKSVLNGPKLAFMETIRVNSDAQSCQDLPIGKAAGIDSRFNSNNQSTIISSTLSKESARNASIPLKKHHLSLTVEKKKPNTELSEKYFSQKSQEKGIEDMKKSQMVDRIDGGECPIKRFSMERLTQLSCQYVETQPTFSDEPLITQFYIRILAEYATPARAFQVWTQTDSDIINATLDFKTFSQCINASCKKLNCSGDDIVRIFAILSQENCYEVNLRNFYRHIENLEEITPNQVLRRLVEVYGNNPLQAFETLGLSLNSQITSVDFARLCFSIGVSDHEASAIWPTLLKNARKGTISCVELYSFLECDQSTTHQHNHQTESMTLPPVDSLVQHEVSKLDHKLLRNNYIFEPSPQVIRVVQQVCFSDYGQKGALQNDRELFPLSRIRLHSGAWKDMKAFSGVKINENDANVVELWKFITRQSLLADVNEDTKRQIRQNLKEKVYSPGSVVLEKGDSIDALYVVYHGFLCAVKNDKVVEFYMTQNHFGVTWENCQGFSPYTVQTLTFTKLIYLECDKEQNYPEDENEKPASVYKTYQPSECQGVETRIDSGNKKKSLKKSKPSQKSKAKPTSKQNTTSVAGNHGRLRKKATLKKKPRSRSFTLDPPKKSKLDDDLRITLDKKSNVLESLLECFESVAELFSKMTPDCLQGYISEKTFCKQVIRLTRELFQNKITVLHKIYDNIARPFHGKLFLSSLYRNLLGSTLKSNVIHSRLEEITPHIVRWPWAAFANVLLEGSTNLLDRMLFHRIMLLIGLTLKDSQCLWDSLLPAQCEAVQGDHLLLFFKGELSSKELYERSNVHQSLLVHITKMFDFGHSPESNALAPSTLMVSSVQHTQSSVSLDINSQFTTLESHITEVYECPVIESISSDIDVTAEMGIVFQTLVYKVPFRCLHKRQLKYVIAQMSRVVLEPSTCKLWEKKQEASAMYILVSGILEFHTTDSVFNIDTSCLIANPGSVFSENALYDLTDPQLALESLGEVSPVEYSSAALWRSKGPAESILWCLTREKFMLSVRPMLLERLGKLPYIYRALDCLPMLSHLNDIEKLRLTEETKVEVFVKNTTIVCVKHVGIILSGQATGIISATGKLSSPLVKKQQHYKPGESFGTPLVNPSVQAEHPQPRKVKAKTTLKVLSISEDTWSRIVKANAIYEDYKIHCRVKLRKHRSD